MKTLKLFTFLILTSFFASAQGTYIQFGATVLDANGMPVANHPVTVMDSTSNLMPGLIATYLTNSAGQFSDSVYTGVAGTMFMFTTDSCQTIMLDTVYTGNTTSLNWYPTFNLCNGGGASNCNYTVSANGSPGGTAWQFSTSHQSNPVNPSTYIWSFGDGTTGSGPNPMHTYSAAGTYTYCLSVDNCPAVCDTIVVASATAGSLYNISALVLTNNYQNTVPNYPVIVIDSSSAPNPTVMVYNYTTDANGEVHDSIFTSGVTGSLWFLAPDSCGFTRIALGYAPNSPSTLATAGLVLCNNIVVGPTGCDASFTAQASGLMVDIAPVAVGGTGHLEFYWGDGTVDTVNASAQPIVPYNHTYAAAGTYTICVNHYQTLNGVVTCIDSTCATITVPGSNVTSCNAEFIVDTVNSFAGNIVIWNTSTLVTTANQVNSFLWNFGDGFTSTQAFPTHSYANPGMYNICLTVSSLNITTQDSCESTYCDSLGVDANGNLIYKGAAGWTLNVLDPNSIGIEENLLSGISTYPNPVNDLLYLEIPEDVQESLHLSMYTVSGILVQEYLPGAVNTSIDMANLPNGLYILQAEYKDQLKTIKVIKQD